MLRVGKTRTVVNLDFFNLFNRNAVTGENAVLNPVTLVFRTPTQIMLARFLKIGARFDF